MAIGQFLKGLDVSKNINRSYKIVLAIIILSLYSKILHIDLISKFLIYRSLENFRLELFRC